MEEGGKKAALASQETLDATSDLTADAPLKACPFLFSFYLTLPKQVLSIFLSGANDLSTESSGENLQKSNVAY